MKKLGVPLEDATSWSTSPESTSGIRLLLEESGLRAEAQTEIVEIEIAIEKTVDGLEDYFQVFSSILYHETARVLASRGVQSAVLLLNLLPLYLGPTQLDKIAGALYDPSHPPVPLRHFVFLLRNVDWLIRSSTFQAVIAAGRLRAETLAIDLRSYGMRVSMGGHTESFQTSREPFRKILRTDDRSVYSALIYGTNSYIGHFALDHAHARTHYDLTEYVKRDNIWEYLLYNFIKQLGESQRVIILGVGMEAAVVYRLGEQLQTLLPDQVQDFRFVSGRNPADVIRAKLASSVDRYVILTDIVNTGMTLKPWVEEINRLNGLGKIMIFAVARMRNSPHSLCGVAVDCGVVIKRDYYPSDPRKCRLCLVGQPKIRVRSVEDFWTVLPEQLTPFDFWEIVTDAKALKHRELDHQGRVLNYRIDTKELLRRYGSWLGNIIGAKFKTRIPNMRPNIVCSVAEPPGRSFAELVSRTLEVEEVVFVERKDLARVTTNAGLPEDIKNPFEGSANPRNVLIVDDGINYGETIHSLIAFCRAAGATPIGAMVLDSRLAPARVKRIQESMFGRPLIALYEWPSIMPEL
jgi:orotate phosphoribosyltransferase-like protein